MLARRAAFALHCLSEAFIMPDRGDIMSTSLTRRGFAIGAGAAVFSAITSRKGFSAQTQDQKVEVNAGAEIGVINPLLHSHFSEHLGSCIYGGLWVGRNSKIPT